MESRGQQGRRRGEGVEALVQVQIQNSQRENIDKRYKEVQYGSGI